jgi:hypothetical protein
MGEKLGFNKYGKHSFREFTTLLGQEKSVVHQEVGKFLLQVPHLLVKAKYSFDMTKFSDRLVR